MYSQFTCTCYLAFIISASHEFHSEVTKPPLVGTCISFICLPKAKGQINGLLGAMIRREQGIYLYKLPLNSYSLLLYFLGPLNTYTTHLPDSSAFSFPGGFFTAFLIEPSIAGFYEEYPGLGSGKRSSL